MGRSCSGRSRPWQHLRVDARREKLFALARATKGFMPDDEGEALHAAALEAGRAAPGATLVEVGAWCGKSTLYLGAAAEATGSVVLSVDHHHGSEEQQVGWEHFDPELVDAHDGRLNTLPAWQRSVSAARLEASVVGLVGDSVTVASRVRGGLALCFIDGGHGSAPAWADYRAWSPLVADGGLLCIHDVFEDPAEGGRPPYELYCEAVATSFDEVSRTGSLRVLRRRSDRGADR
jgi:MMP 1-O-methyltransferase